MTPRNLTQSSRAAEIHNLVLVNMAYAQDICKVEAPLHPSRDVNHVVILYSCMPAVLKMVGATCHK